MPNYINEESVENLALEGLKNVGYEIYKSESYISPNRKIDAERNNDHSVCILEKRLLNALIAINPGYDSEIYENALRQFKVLADNPNMMINNHHLHQLIINGARVKTNVNGENRTATLYPIDFNDVQKNDFIATNQFTVTQGNHERRPDVTLFINGLPLVTFEFKDSANQNVGIQEAFKQFETYKSEIPDYMQYNEILIVSDAIHTRAGSLTAGIDRFMRWRSPKDIAENKSDLELDVMIKNMLPPKTLLNIIENFIIFETNGDQTVKIVAAYHQYYMVNKAVKVASKVVKDPEDKRIGVVWHTTGSGKSLSMVFFSGIAARKMGNPTILVINDRNDLDDQLYGTFAAAHEFLGQNPVHADDRDDVRKLMSTNSGGIVFSTIQKFAPDFDHGESDMPVLTDRQNVIVIADEAHRTQYGLEAKYTDNGIRYGFAKYLRDALPNASFMGFTGTPINVEDKSTTQVFGDYIDVYDITQAVNDHATVRIYYESHVIPLAIKKGMEAKYNQMMEEYSLNDDPEIEENERRNRDLTRLEALAGTRSRLEKIAEHFVTHFEARQKEQFGKSMLVEMSRVNAVKLYDQIIKIRPDWASDDLDKGKIKIIMTSNASDGPEISKHHTNKSDRLKLQKRMKDNDDELQIVIVVDMWLTGFDVPSLNTMYIDKPMHGHNLIQAIARVNRVFKDKNSGLIVDYIGIAESLKQALNHYSSKDQGQVGINMEKAMALLIEKYQIIKKDYLYGFDYSDFDSEDHSKRIRILNQTANYLLRMSEEDIQKFSNVVTQLQKAFALVSTQQQAQDLAPEIAFFKTLKVYIGKLQNDDFGGGDEGSKDIDYKMRQFLDQSIISEPHVDIYKDLGLERPNLDVISDQFLSQVENMQETNTAIALLTRLLEGKVKSLNRTNIVKSRDFKEMLEDSIKKYNERGITSELVIRELIEMAKKINAEQAKGKDLGLNSQEVAFYDALADHKKAVEILGEEKLQIIAVELVKLVKENSGVDWEKREAVQAKMRIAVRDLLRYYGYPPEIRKSAVSTVVEQAEKMAASK
ncbi:type I restriction endonuclease subunit R [Companilactobacillus furfuricola]|uniref:type I restriction endonuclease subunit R n=1 Tax=Companilactobacillus furfuricola TaxID=1462575 RepID=UPI000F7AEE56|nr:type I restriction endonuclease subunit R [Companilactobacillus furfuricola]